MSLNYYTIDRTFRRMMHRLLPENIQGWADETYTTFGALCGDTLDALAITANRHQPQLRQYDKLGNRIDVMEYHPDYLALAKYAYEAGVVGLPFDAGLKERFGRVPHTVNLGLGYLLGQIDPGLFCPVCLTDGTAMLIDKYASPELREQYLPLVTSLDFTTLWQGAMWLTEKAGGSDVGATETVARRVGDHWELTGQKWFCSNADAKVVLTLGRPEGAAAGTRGLGLFLMPSILPDGARNHYTIDRLKEKLGVVSMPTGEVTLNGAIAYQVGPIDHGFVQMAEMLNLSRLYNSIASVSIMRRALVEAREYTRTRVAFGQPIANYPLVQDMLVRLTVEQNANLLLVFRTAWYFDRVNNGLASEGEHAIRRLLTPVVKLYTAKKALWAASEAMELHGGNGYIEDFVLARLLRDAQVLPIWEGTTNILVLDMLRALAKTDALTHLLAAVDEHLASVMPDGSATLRHRLVAERDAVANAAAALRELPEGPRTLAARVFADRLAQWYSAVLLLDAAARETDTAENAHLLNVGIALADQYGLGSAQTRDWLGEPGRLAGFAEILSEG